MKKPIFVFLLGVLMFSSCKTYYFENPQPSHTRELKSFPSELIGTYFELNADTIKHENEDPLVITDDSYNYKTGEPMLRDMKKEGSLKPGKVVLKKVKKYYILSQKVKNPLENSPDSLWEVYAIKYKDNQLAIYSMIYSDENGGLKVDSTERINNKLLSDSIRTIVSVKEHRVDNDMYYLINPSKKQFIALLENNLFRKILEFEKVK